MRYTIVSDLPETANLPGRIRIMVERGTANAAASALGLRSGVLSVSASSVTGSLIVLYKRGARSDVLAAAAGLDTTALEPYTKPELGLDFRKRLYAKIAAHIARRLLLPAWLRIPIDIFHALRFVRAALAALRRGKLNVEVLDGAAIMGAMLQGDFSSASTVMLLLGVSELLEDYTHKKARGALSQSLVLNVDTVWVREDGAERQIPLPQLQIGAMVIARCGSVIPADGVVLEGEAAVNQASLTGEPTAVFKRSGDSVFAGTAVEDGSLVIETRSVAAESRVARILDLIERSESLKADVQNRAERTADKIVPLSFALTAAAFAFGGAQKALSALLVDYSCAVKLSTPIAVISAMREASAHKIVVKGGKFLETAAEADTVVFDKTGTLTVACPEVTYVGAFGDFSRDEVLRTAACIEEHFPHSLARAVIRKANAEGLHHEETHAEPLYIAAHGIATAYGDKRVVLGSRHFVGDDEGIEITQDQMAQLGFDAQGGSVLYLGVDGKLAGYLCIADPPRAEAAEVIAALRGLGVRRVVMLTGDGEQAARAMAAQLGIDEYRAQVLPEDKQIFIESLKASGNRVMMVGDGINDSPALAAADVSVSMRDASDLAREAADVTLFGDDLRGLVTLRVLGMRLLKRIRGNFGFIVGFNSALIAAGLSGAISASTLALLHNASTVAVSAGCMRPLLDGK